MHSKTAATKTETPITIRIRFNTTIIPLTITASTISNITILITNINTVLAKIIKMNIQLNKEAFLKAIIIATKIRLEF